MLHRRSFAALTALTGKDIGRIGSVDDLLVGRANIIHERGEHDVCLGRYI